MDLAMAGLLHVDRSSPPRIRDLDMPPVSMVRATESQASASFVEHQFAGGGRLNACEEAGGSSRGPGVAVDGVGWMSTGAPQARFCQEQGVHPVTSEATSGWTRRVRIGKAPVEREVNPNRKSALEVSMRAFIVKRDGNVFNPSIGTSFDSLDEAYQFYNLYSWEVGFGIKYAKSRLNVHRVKCMQEIVCGCVGKPVRENSRSTRTSCQAMIRDEKEDTFKWVFREFIRLVGGKRPQTILIDQVRSMELAIEAELPGTVHRWCKWHVLKKAKESMGTLWNKNSDFKNEFHKLVHHMICEQEFEDGWAVMLDKYSLRKHPFLTQIYEVRHKWAKPYFRGVFCAKMTSTQRGESANHMLKSYVPPGCPMHMFLKQYEKLQFDRDSEESFQEKRTSLSGVSLRVNLPIERHASKIYTRSMFEQFGEALYKAGVHVMDVIEPGKVYLVSHVEAASREKWSKVEFKVEVDAGKTYFSCECGWFEHSGMVCCHALKVMIELRLSKIPEKHIVKRWTRDARDILPDHLVRYQKDSGPSVCDTFRHSAMYIKALECVQLGDNNVKCYDVFMAMMNDVYSTLLPLSHDKDGMGLEDKEAAQCVVGTKRPYVDNADLDGDAMSNCSGIAPAKEKRLPGRPTTNRDKAPYENKLKRSRFCTICRLEGHKSTNCPLRGDLPKAPRKLPKCSKCGVLGHRKNACGKPAQSFQPNFL